MGAPRPAVEVVARERACAAAAPAGGAAADHPDEMYSFVVRLLVAALLSFVVVGVVGERLLAHTIRNAFIDEQLADQQADARSIGRAIVDPGAGEDPTEEAQELIEVIASRPGVGDVKLIDAAGVVIVASEHGDIGQVESGRAVQVARTGRTHVGVDVDRGARRGDLEYLVPVLANGRRLALETDQPHEVLDARIAGVRRQVLVAGLVGLPCALLLFYLAGGRQLTRRHESALERSLTDALTGLGNHSAFYEVASQHVALAERHGHHLALAVVDIDDFKFCNDRLGHDYGDRVLRGVAEALAGGRRGDAFFRLGGDEFAVLLPHTDARGARVALADALGRAQAALPGISLSVGVGVLSTAAGDFALLREQADAAVYEAKRTIGSAVVVFDEISAGATLAHPDRVRGLGELLEHGELDVAFQPIWDLERDDILGYEALARPAERFGFSGPGELFDLAERLGNAHLLDEIARRSALRRAADLPPHTLLFVNVSPKSLERDMLAGTTLVDAVHSAGLAPHQLVLELTEHPTPRLRHVVREVARLRELGFKVALDDVGAGNAGLELLCSVAVDFVKIDRSVVSNAARDASALGVLEAVIAYATRTNATVIAEGIETEAELELVREPAKAGPTPRRPVRAGQGYLLGRPSPAFAQSRNGAGPSRPELSSSAERSTVRAHS